MPRIESTTDPDARLYKKGVGRPRGWPTWGMC